MHEFEINSHAPAEITLRPEPGHPFTVRNVGSWPVIIRDASGQVITLSARQQHTTAPHSSIEPSCDRS